MILSPINLIRELRHSVLVLSDLALLNRVIGGSRWRRDRLLILCYHGISVADEHEWSDLYVSPAHFEKRLHLLKKEGATVLPLDEALNRLRRGDLPDKAVSLTFDDGMHDFAAKAMPILQAGSVHATLYLTTYYCGRPQPVFDTAASYLLWKGRGKTIRVPGIDKTVTVPMDTSLPAFIELHNSIRRYAQNVGLDANSKNDLARKIATAVGQDFDALLQRRILQLMTEEEIVELDRNHVTVQLHTHRHRTPREREAFAGEIETNARLIQALRGNGEPLTHFCYPSGDYMRECAEWLKDHRVEWATTCNPGLASPLSEPYFLPRIIDTEKMTSAAFKSWVSGLGMFVFARRRTSSARF